MSAGPLVVVARIVATTGRAAEVEAALQSLLSPTRREPGCELYTLHHDLDDPETFVMLERWRTEAAWLAHRATRHVAEFERITTTASRPFTSPGSQRRREDQRRLIAIRPRIRDRPSPQ